MKGLLSKIDWNIFTNHENRILGLDFIRALAIGLVLFSHGTHYIAKEDLNFYWKFRLTVIDGVSVFFVLSGYLIGRILIRTLMQTNFEWRDLTHFWIRRWFRTLPNYYLCLFFLLLVEVYVHHALPDAFSWKYLFFLQNFDSPHPKLFSEAWSLSVEEWFYLLFPLLMFIFLRLSSIKRLSLLMPYLLFLLVPLALRLYIYYDTDLITNPGPQMRKVVIYRLDSISYGVLAAYLQLYAPNFWRRARIPLFCFTIGMLVLLYFDKQSQIRAWSIPLYYNLESIITFAALPVMAAWKRSKWTWFNKSIAAMSILSYAMYLLNLAIISGIVMGTLFRIANYYDWPLPRYGFIPYCLFWIFTIVASYFLYVLFERPMTNLRDRYSFLSKKVTVMDATQANDE